MRPAVRRFWHGRRAARSGRVVLERGTERAVCGSAVADDELFGSGGWDGCRERRLGRKGRTSVDGPGITCAQGGHCRRLRRRQPRRAERGGGGSDLRRDEAGPAPDRAARDRPAAGRRAVAGAGRAEDRHAAGAGHAGRLLGRRLRGARGHRHAGRPAGARPVRAGSATGPAAQRGQGGRTIRRPGRPGRPGARPPAGAGGDHDRRQRRHPPGTGHRLGPPSEHGAAAAARARHRDGGRHLPRSGHHPADRAAAALAGPADVPDAGGRAGGDRGGRRRPRGQPRRHPRAGVRAAPGVLLRGPVPSLGDRLCPGRRGAPAVRGRGARPDHHRRAGRTVHLHPRSAGRPGRRPSGQPARHRGRRDHRARRDHRPARTVGAADPAASPAVAPASMPPDRRPAHPTGGRTGHHAHPTGADRHPPNRPPWP